MDGFIFMLAYYHLPEVKTSIRLQMSYLLWLEKSPQHLFKHRIFKQVYGQSLSIWSRIGPLDCKSLTSRDSRLSHVHHRHPCNLVLAWPFTRRRKCCSSFCRSSSKRSLHLGLGCKSHRLQPWLLAWEYQLSHLRTQKFMTSALQSMHQCINANQRWQCTHLNISQYDRQFFILRVVDKNIILLWLHSTASIIFIALLLEIQYSILKCPKISSIKVINRCNKYWHMSIMLLNMSK